jgi:hypothetical protein
MILWFRAEAEAMVESISGLLAWLETILTIGIDV